MLNYNRIGACTLGSVYTHDYSHIIIVIADDGTKLGAREMPGVSRFWWCEDTHALIDGDTGNMYEVN